ncbi:MAG: hypothetical protein Q8N23_04735 [Archangium sp.]|nr:hypothetical protein [Archangium sp.]MDP3571363.1 hypothetical protein [Archangium sp.]
MLRLSVVLAVVSSAAWAAPVVAFSAPPALRKPLAAELIKQGREPLDLSDLDQLLFGPDGAAAAVTAGKPFELEPRLPAALRGDFALGLAGCRARSSTDKAAKRACADQLVGALWERHLARLRPERVIELKLMPIIDATSVAVASYKPGDSVIGSAMWPDSTRASLQEIVSAAIHDALIAVAGRANSQTLPEKVPLPPADLRQGAPQILKAEPPPERCKLPAKLALKPAGVPLSVTMVSLWEASVTGSVKPDEKPLQCALAITEGSLTFTCDGLLSEQDLFAGTPFGDAALQAAFARRFVERAMHTFCANEAATR